MFVPPIAAAKWPEILLPRLRIRILWMRWCSGFERRSQTNCLPRRGDPLRSDFGSAVVLGRPIARRPRNIPFPRGVRFRDVLSPRTADRIGRFAVAAIVFDINP